MKKDVALDQALKLLEVIATAASGARAVEPGWIQQLRRLTMQIAGASDDGANTLIGPSDAAAIQTRADQLQNAWGSDSISGNLVLDTVAMSDEVATSGWAAGKSASEKWRWTNSEREAVLRLANANDDLRWVGLHCTLLSSEQTIRNGVVFSANFVGCPAVMFASDRVAIFWVLLPENALQVGKDVELIISVRDSYRPRDLKISSDSRVLGISVKKIITARLMNSELLPPADAEQDKNFEGEQIGTA